MRCDHLQSFVTLTRFNLFECSKNSLSVCWSTLKVCLQLCQKGFLLLCLSINSSQPGFHFWSPDTGEEREIHRKKLSFPNEIFQLFIGNVSESLYLHQQPPAASHSRPRLRVHFQVRSVGCSALFVKDEGMNSAWLPAFGQRWIMAWDEGKNLLCRVINNWHACCVTCTLFLQLLHFLALTLQIYSVQSGLQLCSGTRESRWLAYNKMKTAAWSYCYYTVRRCTACRVTVPVYCRTTCCTAFLCSSPSSSLTLRRPSWSFNVVQIIRSKTHISPQASKSFIVIIVNTNQVTEVPVAAIK